MARMYEHSKVDASYLNEAPARAVVRQTLPVPPGDLFRCLEDGDAWKLWLLDSVTWTTPLPHGVGTTRTIRMGPITADEHFFVWEPGRRFAFRFDRSTIPAFGAFAEDYVINDLGAGTCELVWTMAFELRGPGRFVHGPTAAGMRISNQRALGRLARVLSENPSRWSRATGDVQGPGGSRR